MSNITTVEDAERILTSEDKLILGFLNSLVVFNEINSRDMEKINIFRGMFSSWIFLGIISATVAFQVIIVEFRGTFASTVPLSWELWLLSVLIAAVSLPLAVVLKCIAASSITVMTR